MQTGNVFDLLGVSDPDGDPIRITHWQRPGSGLVSMTNTGTGDFVPSGGEVDTVLNIMPNGDFTFNPASAKTGRFGPQTFHVEIRYTDDKAADHTADSTPDQVNQIITFEFEGDMAENQAPGALVGTINYTPD